VYFLLINRIEIKVGVEENLVVGLDLEEDKFVADKVVAVADTVVGDKVVEGTVVADKVVVGTVVGDKAVEDKVVEGTVVEGDT